MAEALIPPAIIEILLSAPNLDTTIAEVQAAIASLPKDATIPIGADEKPLISDLADAKLLIDGFTKVPNLFDLKVNQGALTGSLAASKTSIEAFARAVYNINLNPIIGKTAEGVAVTEMKALTSNLAALGVVPIDPIVTPAAIAATMAQLNSTILAAKAWAELHPIPVEVDPAFDVAALEATLQEMQVVALLHPITEAMRTDTDALLASLDATIAAAQADALLHPIEVPVKPKNIGATALLGLAAPATGAGTGEAGAGGILSSLGWGAGLAGMAKFGSALSLLGLSLEHVFGTAIGLVGSFAGAVAGGGVLALGAMGTAAVGMGTDLAGIGQAAGDIKNVYTALAQGPAAVATALQGFSAIARSSVLTAALTAQSFHQMFNNATGAAEATGAQIINQAMIVGESFLPTIGKYAAENMDIIKKDIQPFFSWLQKTTTQSVTLPNLGKTTIGTGGLSIFQNLEQIFQKQLPEAIKAATQGFELFAKVVDIAAQYSGHLITTLANWFTKMNSPSELQPLAKVIGDLIGLFRAWLGLFVSIGKMLTALFTPAVGFGKQLVMTMAGVIGKFTDFLKLGTTKDNLQAFFEQDKKFVVLLGAAITAVLPIIEGFITGFINAATVIRSLVNDALGPLIGLLNKLSAHWDVAKIVGYVVEIVLLAKAFSSVGAAIDLLVGKSMMALLAKIPLIGSAFEGTAATVATEDTVIEGANAAASKSFSAMLGPIGLVAAAALALHGPITSAVNSVSHAIFGTINNSAQAQQAYDAALQKTSGNAAAIQQLNTAFTNITKVFGFTIKEAGPPVGQSLMEGLANGVIANAGTANKAVADAADNIAAIMRTHTQSHSPSQVFALIGQDLMAGLAAGIGDTSSATAILQVLQGLSTKMQKVFKDAIPIFNSLGQQLMQGLASGITAGAALVAAAAQQAALAAENATRSATGTHSPSTVYAAIGRDLMAGLALGLRSAQGVVQAALTSSLPHVSTGSLATGATGVAGGSAFSQTNTFQITAASGSPTDIQAAVKKGIDQANTKLIQSIRAGTI